MADNQIQTETTSQSPLRKALHISLLVLMYAFLVLSIFAVIVVLTSQKSRDGATNVFGHQMRIVVSESMVEAAAIPEAFATAYLNLFIEGKIKEGNTLLMNAGASGLASVIIPMAKAFGVRVITTVLTDEIAENIKHLNADRVVVTTKEDISLVLKEELEAGHSVDVAIDCLGGEIMGKCIHYLTHGARWIMIAALAGTKTEIDLKNIYVRNVRIVGSTLRSRTPAVKAEILAGIVRDVYPKIEAGLVKPTIHAVLPIEEAEAAHDILYKGKNVGKVVLTVS